MIPPSPSAAPGPQDATDWSSITRIVCLVLTPAVLGAIPLQFGRSFWWTVAAVVIVLGSGAFSVFRLVSPLRRIESRLRKTDLDLQSVLAEVDSPVETVTTQPGLLAAEEQLYATSSRARSTVKSLRELARRLEENTSLFEGVLETMQEAVLVIDASENLLFINSAARSLFDVPRARGIGQLAWQCVRSGQLQGIILRALASGESLREAVELPRQKRMLEVSAVTLSLRNGIGCLAVAYDVTELRRLESMRRDFVSNVSHELKTPLTSIQAYADTLLNGGLEDQDSSRLFVERIAEQSERLSALIQDLLRLARIESQKEAFRIERCDARTIADLAYQDHQTIAATRLVALEESIEEGRIEVLADADGLRTILNNLISNAIVYTPEGGTVSLTVRNDGPRVLFEVRDTGMGIAREHQTRIFERFYRVDKARSRSVGGTGLGLAIVKHLVEVLKGELTLDSQLGVGSTFRVWLPGVTKN